METLTKVKAAALFDNFETSGNAEPTGRLLPAPWNCGEEWKEEGSYAGKPVDVYYYFDDEDMRNSDGNPLEAENYPWDFDHVCGIVVDGVVVYNSAVFGKHLGYII